MRKFRWLWFVGIFVFLMGCSSGMKLTETQESAQNDFQAGNYADALTKYEEIIGRYENNGQWKECPVYPEAGIAALKLNNVDKGLEYLKKAVQTPFAGEEAYIELAGLYRNIDNLSLEIETLEDYVKKFPEGAGVLQAKMRLFQTYVESENWDKAEQLWPEIESQAGNDISYLEGYYRVNKALGDTAMVDQLAGRLLEMNDENVTGLEYMAKKYYNMAENLYQSELKKYEAHKTRKQYAALLKTLEEVTDEFQKALGYFETLYHLNPKPSYANYIGNIYTRFNDKEKADYYHKLGGTK